MAGVGLEFNLSHTSDWAAVVVARGLPCGIDIERIRPIPQMLDIARTASRPRNFARWNNSTGTPARAAFSSYGPKKKRGPKHAAADSRFR